MSCPRGSHHTLPGHPQSDPGNAWGEGSLGSWGPHAAASASGSMCVCLLLLRGLAVLFLWIALWQMVFHCLFFLESGLK